ncbi:LysR family transcriptional regulator [Pseudooctadecabacter jejudonensis]|uniref:LysR family transcriptional regulator n=1 Tax=Pseudooctadecabacter jejudonensis TaxID=1391910 RepID=UPI001F22AA29|nr:LysR family transcriptional regulator [Pseudooctadecabacter jejudonensis]
MKLFVTVVDQGSIAKAADVMSIAKSAVSRRLAQLEGRYDVRLIDRQPGKWWVTDAGRELYQRANPMLADADDLDRDFMQPTRNLSGPLRVTIAHEFGMTFLKPMLFRFAKDFPEIELAVDFDDRTIDLDRENYDLAIRITSKGPGGDSDITIGQTRHGLFASPDYLRDHGMPCEPRDLRDHALLQYGPSRRAIWKFEFDGKPCKLEFKPYLNSRTGAFLKDAAVDGMGIVRMLDFVVRQDVEAKRLIPVLPRADFENFGVHLIHAPNRRLNKRMRAFSQAVLNRCADFQP